MGKFYFFDGRGLRSRPFFCAPSVGVRPAKGLPLEPLDGELWIDRKRFQRAVSIVRRQDQTQLWREVRFRIFDAPGEDGGFEARLNLVQLIIDMNRPPFAVAHEHFRCMGTNHLQTELDRVMALGGEGLMQRRPGSA